MKQLTFEVPIGVAIENTVFWYAAPGISVEFTDVSEENAASFFGGGE
jgi:hypothetical protein